MNTPPLGNLFLLLDLELNVESPVVIEAALEKKKTLWNKTSLDHRSQLHLQRVPDIRAALLDRDARALYRDYAQAEKVRLATAAQGRLEALIETLKLTMREGAAVIPAEIERIAEAVRPIPRAKVIAAIETAGLYCANTDAKPGATTKMNCARIDELLDQLCKGDLYQWLDVNPTTSLSELQRQTNTEYVRVQSKPAGNVQRQLVQELVGRAKVAFRDNTARKEYDTHLVDLRLRSLDPHIELLGRRERCITADQLELLKARAAKLGASAVEVEDYVVRYGDTADFLVYHGAQIPRRGTPMRLFCADCGTEARSPTESNCRECGQLLRRNCFACNGLVVATDVACTACGLLLADVAELDAKMAAARAAAAAGDADIAMGLLREVLAKYPNHEPAIAALAAIATRARQAVATRTEIDVAIRERLLRPAERALTAAISAFGTSLFEEQRTQLQAMRARSAEANRKAREAMRCGQLDEAEAYFETALEIVADDAEARVALNALPVDSPRGLNITLVGAQVRMDWKPGKAGTRYRVLRGLGVAVAPDDATELAEQSSPGWTDAAPPRGLTLHYGVIALRRGIASAITPAKPVIVPDAPAEFRAMPGDRQIVLSWKLPRGAAAVKLRSSTNEGVERSWRLDGDTFVDNGLHNGETVNYTLLALFIDPTGDELPSSVVRASATPSVALEPIRSLTASREGESVLFTWQPPALGQAQIRLLRSALTQLPGTQVSMAALAELGTVITVQSSGPGSGRANLGELRGDVARFVAVNLDANSATLGATADVVTLDPVRDVRMKASGGSIELQWTWPLAGDHVTIAWRYDRAPESPIDPQATKHQVSRAEYSRMGAFRIMAAPKCPHHFALWVQGSGAWSNGVFKSDSMGVAERVSYNVRHRLLGGRRFIELAGPVGAVLTNVEVYAREDRPPVERSQGVLIASASKLTLTGGRAELEAPRGIAGHFIKVFCDQQDLFLLSSKHKDGSQL